MRNIFGQPNVGFNSAPGMQRVPNPFVPPVGVPNQSAPGGYTSAPAGYSAPGISNMPTPVMGQTDTMGKRQMMAKLLAGIGSMIPGMNMGMPVQPMNPPMGTPREISLMTQPQSNPFGFGRRPPYINLG